MEVRRHRQALKRFLRFERLGRFVGIAIQQREVARWRRVCGCQITTSNEETWTPPTVLSGVVVRTKGKRIRYLQPDQVPKAFSQPVVRRPAKVARLLALAHHIQNAVDRGVVADCATAARQLGLTRARLTQLLDLALLAPEIQEKLLELEAVNGVEPTYERRLRRVVRVANWGKQRQACGESASL